MIKVHETGLLLDEHGHLTDVTVQDLVNAVCDLLDGTPDHHIVDVIGDEDRAKDIAGIRLAIRGMWTYADGEPVIKR